MSTLAEPSCVDVKFRPGRWQDSEGECTSLRLKAGVFQLALPVGPQVRLASRGSWDQADTLAHASVHEDLSLVAFSGCGELLAAASRQGKLFLWDWAASQLLHT